MHSFRKRTLNVQIYLDEVIVTLIVLQMRQLGAGAHFILMQDSAPCCRADPVSRDLGSVTQCSFLGLLILLILTQLDKFGTYKSNFNFDDKIFFLVLLVILIFISV